VGLDITVGFLIDQLENDEEGADWFRDEVEGLNSKLRAAGLQEHGEPEDGFEPESFAMVGYSGLHTLRLVAAYDAAGRGLPRPYLETDNTDDPLVDAYYERHEQRSGGLFRRARPREPGPYGHLMLHADNEGFYVPQDFADPIEYEIGSSHRLLAECDRLAALLQIPDRLTPESEELWEASDEGGAELWQRYGVESFTCVGLRAAARARSSSSTRGGVQERALPTAWAPQALREEPDRFADSSRSPGAVAASMR
jgi:hypothetical protein